MTLTAVVTGANRGIGFETSRQLARRGYRVILTSRDRAAGEDAVRSLVQGGFEVVYRPLDVADLESIRKFKQTVEHEFGGIDVLVNNAAVYPDEGESVLRAELAVFQQTFKTNFFGPLALLQAFGPGMLARGYGRVVNVSSGAGQISTMTDYAPSYSASKAALNALTRMAADAAKGSNVLINAVDPGWVRTQMGGPRAPRSIEKGAETIVWLATLPDGGPTGGFFRDRKAIPW